MRNANDRDDRSYTICIISDTGSINYARIMHSRTVHESP